MNTPVPSTPSPSSAAALAGRRGESGWRTPAIDEPLHGFGRRTAQALIVLCGLVLLFYIGRAGWDYIAGAEGRGHAAGLSPPHDPEQVEGLCRRPPGPLPGGVAELQLADEAYAAGGWRTPPRRLHPGHALLKTGPLAARAQLGLAMAKIQSAVGPRVRRRCSQLADDTHQLRPSGRRPPTSLASLAASAGRADEVQKLGAQLMQMDPQQPLGAAGLRAPGRGCRPGGRARPLPPLSPSPPADRSSTGRPLIPRFVPLTRPAGTK